MTSLPRLIAGSIAILVSLSSSLAAAPFTRTDWQEMQRWEVSADAVAIPAEGVQFRIGQASWSLSTGTLRFMKPVNEVITGFVFEGTGTMSMTVPDRVELSQLRRFSGDSSLSRLDLSFDQLVVRSSDLPLRDLAPASASWTESRIAAERRDTLIELGGLDADARIIGALTDPGDRFTMVDMKTDRWDWIRYTWDEKEIEEIQLVHMNRRYGEVWLSLDREEGRLPSGRPGKQYEPRANLEHIDVSADLTRRGRGRSVGRSHTNPILAQFVAKVSVAPRVDGMRSLHFNIHPFAKLSSVTDEQGAEVVFLRDHIGSRAFSLDNDYHDDDVLVLLEEPTSAGAAVKLTFEYELEITNYVGGSSWYPTIANNYLESHTARLELTAPHKYEVFAMGQKTDTRRGEDSETTVWAITTPTPMVTFAVGDDFRSKEIELEDSINVVAFGPVMGLGKRNMIHNVAADVANSTRFFAWLFDHPLPSDTIYVTSIAAGHGQAFDGFLHMSEGTFDAEHPGASELFRAHEVAHQWWGHQVGWKTYRDQWLSESFAEYSAMMFVQASMKNGDALFNEIIDVYTSILNGSLRGAFSKFYRPWLIEMNDSFRGRLGPIDIGYRAGTAEMPAGYVIQSYYKGPLVIHMLRTMLRNQTRSEDAFLAILRDFVATHAGGAATTEDLQRILEKHYPGDWSWFFEQWIYRADIPTLRYDIDMARSPNAKGAYPVTVRVEKSDVPADFITPVPIRVELEGDKVAMMTAIVRQAEQTFEFELPARPRKVEFNPDHAILAKVSKM